MLPHNLAAILLALLLGDPIDPEDRRRLAAFILRALRAGIRWPTKPDCEPLTQPEP